MHRARSTNNRIIVPRRTIQGGFDDKFEEDSYGVNLHGLLTQQDYTDSIRRVNERLKPSRSTKFDTVLLATSPLLLVPLAVWGARHGRQAKRRKRLLHEAIADFHTTHPHLLMRWNRRPDSFLSIELRADEPEAVLAPIAAMAVAAEGEDRYDENAGDGDSETRHLQQQPLSAPAPSSGIVYTGHSLE